MKLSSQVCTYQQAKRLKELGVAQGFSQHIHWSWAEYDAESRSIVTARTADRNAQIYIDAYSVAELGIMLPRNFGSFYCGQEIWRIANTFNYAQKNAKEPDIVGTHFWGTLATYVNISGRTEAEVRANLLLVLLEKNIFTVDDVNTNINLSNAK